MGRDCYGPSLLWAEMSRNLFNEKTRDSRDGTIQCPVFSDTQPGRDCPVFSTRKHGSAVTGQSNVPYFQTHNRDGTVDCPVSAVPCFLVENTGQSRRDNVPYFQTDSLDGTIMYRVFTTGQPGRDGTYFLSRPVPASRILA